MKTIQKADVKGLLAGKYVNRLIEVMKYGGTRAMQMDAAVALGMLGDKKAVGPLVEMVNSSSYWIDTRVYAVQSLGKIGGKKAIEALNQATDYKDFHGRSEDVEAIRTAAKTALALLSDSQKFSQAKKWWQFWK